MKMPKKTILRFSFYDNSRAVAIQAFDEDGELYTRISVNLDGVGKPSAEYRTFPYVAIKNYSENEGITEWLIEKGIINKEPVAVTSSGYVKVPTHRFTEKWEKLLIAMGKRAHADALEFEV